MQATSTVRIRSRQGHKPFMLEAVPHPYAVEIKPSGKSDGSYIWAIRKRGALIERSDRTYTSEAKAHERALEAVMQDIKFGGQSGRR